MQADLIARLLADPALTGIAGQSVFWARRPQGILPPLVLLRMVSSVPALIMQGEGPVEQSRVQIDCYAQTYAAARAMAAAVKARLGGYSGVVGATRFQGVFRVTEMDMTEGGETDPDRVMRVMLEFMVSWQPAS
jgi:hypothetical protein